MSPNAQEPRSPDLTINQVVHRASTTASIATKHGKQHQFGPPLHDTLGWKIVVADVDTDVLGTFSGEIERRASPIVTARKKARWGMDVTGCHRGLGSEGTFSAHPDAMGMIVAEELVVLIDDVDGLEVVERAITTDVRASRVQVTSPVPSERFLRAAGFPAHALIVTGPGGTGPQRKGLRDLEELGAAVKDCLRFHPLAVVANDLRAFMNPTRQRSLDQLASKLVSRLLAKCPRCEAPGWGVSATYAGRVCRWCGGPTLETAAKVYDCARSGCAETVVDRTAEAGDPAWCPRCNP